MDPIEKQKFTRSLIFPGILLVLIWGIKLVEYFFKIDLSGYGIYPQHASGLQGILFAPLLHGSFAHLSANSVPLFLLSAGLFYFYERTAYYIYGLLWIVTGFWVWVFAKDTGIHIGASGVVYALAAFHFTIGLLKREPKIMAFALLVVFLYGGLIWGVIPNFLPDKNISWESHLLGGVAGVVLAFFFRNQAPDQKHYSWEDEDDDPDEGPPAIEGWNPEQEPQTEEQPEKSTDAPEIIYHFREDKK
jgi:membrane associated rhomboid family serine protease